MDTPNAVMGFFSVYLIIFYLPIYHCFSVDDLPSFVSILEHGNLRKLISK